ncbi:hypothetical protein [Nocardia sp. BMG51109]|uniref:hypothetical protein n=1 Tax=Nocardia sp. BMG51109 TaxID=1056816 RepID=UPI000465FB5E|nr:hypothetical protein [Nocardia sp. BMG51109]
MHEFSAAPHGWPDPVREVFAEAAFGNRPGIAAGELPSAAGPVESWLRAVVLGGRGRYAAARAELCRTRRATADPVLRSLATSTEASLLRQLGWHARAAALDGRALALALPDVPNGDERRDAVRSEAVCDALTGLAADALGTARPDLSARLLERCQGYLEVFPGGSGDRRVRLRWHWVSAETALAASGGVPIATTALRHAETALALAERCPSVRHRVKTRLLLAAAAAAAGDLDRCRTAAEIASAQSRDNGLLPLRWACAMLRAGVGAGSSAARAAAEANACAQALAGQGGLLRSEGGVSRDD